jgi:hypothetical protein
MFQRVLNYIAGVDRETLATCPPTDRIWATHLGVSLCLSFVVVFGISFHATGYMISDVRLQAATSFVIATVVFMFDRALYQSDWFYQGLLRRNEDGTESDLSWKQTAWRLLRVTVRLSISFGLAWVIATFLELAIFSDSISERIEQNRAAANAPVVQKVEQFQSQLDAESDRRRANLEALETALRNAPTAIPSADPSANARFDEIEQRIKALDAEEQGLRSELRELDKNILKYAAEENAEETGQKFSDANSGKSGIGPRYQFAKRQRENLEQQRDARQGEIAQLRTKRDELRAVQNKLMMDMLAMREQEVAGIKAKRESLQGQVDEARASLKQFEARKEERIDAYRREVMSVAHFQAKAKNDPLSRMTAYQELKKDSKDGATIVLFSWMTKLFVIFLEVVPVLAKMFFAPPSVYAARIQARVSGDRLTSQLPKGAIVPVRPQVQVTPAQAAKPGVNVAAKAPVAQSPQVRTMVRPVQVPQAVPQPQGYRPAQPVVQPVALKAAASPPIVPPAKQPVNGAAVNKSTVPVQQIAAQEDALGADMDRLIREARDRSVAGK